MILLYILAAIVAVFLALLLFAPKNYHVFRTIVINKPKNEVFEYIKYVKNQDAWSPWVRKDPNMHQEFVGEDGTVGFVSKWNGNKHVGMGEQELLKVNENQGIETQLRFLKPWKSTSDAYITVEDADQGTTKVSWGFSGTNKPPVNVMMLFFNMEKTVGKDFQQGLNDLKSILES